MKWWAFPSWNGDFRLVAGDNQTSQLLIMQPTLHETQLLREFLIAANRKGWTRETLRENEIVTTRTIVLTAPLAKTGPALMRKVKPKDRTLTAVAFKNGHLEVAETASLTALAARAAGDEGARAVSVARPTPSCPDCVPGAIASANEVLQAFLTAKQHADWAVHRAITVYGGQSSHRYLVAHRHSTIARQLRRICYDLDDHFELHFHDWSVPPEEEVLATKLILEHREPWLRNEATCVRLLPDGQWLDLSILGKKYYKNPFGGASDGRPDAALTAALGRTLATAWSAIRGDLRA